MSITDFQQHTLANGLRVLLAPSHDAPVASFWVVYGVGSRNEVPGLTGISHWVEHMMFKGTVRAGSDQVMLAVNREGGTNTAFTAKDYTAYHETLPSDRIAMAIEIEADRMANARFDAAETETERTVILSELQMYQDHPSYQLWEHVEATAFAAHPYRHPVIGYEHDLRTMTRDDLYGHYRRHYSPANATVIVTGDIDPVKLLPTIEERFGAIPAGEAVPAPRAVEPPALTERRVRLRRPAPAPDVVLAYRIPGAAHPDTPVLQVLSAVLSGGDGRMGKSSRLYRALVASGKASSAWSNAEMQIDPSHFWVGASALPDGHVEEIEALLRAEIDKVKDETVSAVELARAKKQLVAALEYGSESVTSQAGWLAQWAMLGNPGRSKTFVDELQAVTADQVQAVLDTSNPTVGHLIPSERAIAAGGVGPVAAMRRAGIDGPGAPTTPFGRAELGNGIVVLSQAQPAAPVVSARIRIPAGSAYDPTDRHGVAGITAQLTTRGTADRTREAFDEAVDDLAVQISIASGREFVEASVTCLADDLPAALDLVAEALTAPSFPGDELDRVRQESLAAIRQAENDTSTVAGQGLRELLFPSGHPLRHSPLGDATSIAAVTGDDVRIFHRGRYSASGMVVAAAGGFSDGDTLARLVDQRFGDWERRPRPSISSALTTGTRTRADHPVLGKQQVDIALGRLVPAPGHSDERAFEVANVVLGQLGMMGRIGERVRERDGMAYYAYSMVQPGSEQSVWLASAGVDPSNVDAAIAGILDVVEAMRREPIKEEELDDAQRYLTGVLPLRLETNAGIARLLLTIEQFGYGLDYLSTYAAGVRAVTREDVQRVTAAWLQTSAIQTSTAGAVPIIVMP